ncbi:nibrin [Zootermopsis nevadensis]|nr:nibrin [Zootermopsis nevadensis]
MDWIHVAQDRGGQYYLLVGKSHVVSRRDGDIILADDQSVSRRHAVITVEHNIKDLGDPSKLPVVSLTDTGSKYGTFVNDRIEASVRLAKDSTEVLRSGDRIRFGLQWNEWRLEYVPLVVTTSTLTPDERKRLQQHIIILGGHVVSSWQDTVSHVTMCSLTLTVKVVCALAKGRPIVTPQYWDNYIRALETKQPCPDCKDYIPPLAETTLNVNEVSFDVNEDRKNLFVGKHFVFSSVYQYNSYSCMVTSAGAKADILEQNGMSFKDLVQPNVIVMQYSFNRPSQESQVSQSFQALKKYLKSSGKRVIPESDIGLAILHCSIDTHCNPDYKIALALVPKETRKINSQPELVVALDTQESESDSIKKIKDEEGASLRPQKRLRSLEDDGFLMKRVAAPQQTKARIKLEHVVKESDEDLFEFPSDKKARITNEEDEDIFAFVDDVKHKPLQMNVHEDETAKLSLLTKKRKLKASETISELSSVSKKHAPEKDVSQISCTESDKDETKEPNVSLSGFLDAVQEPKVNTMDVPMMDIAEGLKNVTVVEMKALIFRNTPPIRAPATGCSHVSSNFKKFRKVQAVYHRPVIRKENLVPYDADTKGLCEWLNETHDKDEMEDNDDDDDWAFFGSSQANKKKTHFRHR